MLTLRVRYGAQYTHAAGGIYVEDGSVTMTFCTVGVLGGGAPQP